MSDLAPRPRGGHQVGTHVTGRFKAASTFERLARVTGDPAADECWSIDRLPGGAQVTHWSDLEATTPCCRRRVRRLPWETDDDMLARATCWRLERGR